MAVASGSIMKPQEIKNLFVANVTNRIMNGVTDAATFTSKVNIGCDGANKHEIDASVRSLPSEDTMTVAAKTNEINNIPMPSAGNYISGKALYKALVSTMSRMGAVRAYTTKWYHQEESEFRLIEEKSGRAVFKDRLANLTPPEKVVEVRQREKTPGRFEHYYDGNYRSRHRYIPPTYENYNVDVYFKSVRGDSEKLNGGWERSTNIGSQNLSVPANPFAEGAIMKAAQVTDLLNKIYNAWAAVCNNKIEYKYYSCHSNCHSSCHGSRSRR